MMKKLAIILACILIGCWPFDPRDSEQPSRTMEIFDTPYQLKKHFIQSFKERNITKYSLTLHDNFKFTNSEGLGIDRIWYKAKDEQYTERLFSSHKIFTENETLEDTLFFMFSGGFNSNPESDTAEYLNVEYQITTPVTEDLFIRGIANIELKKDFNSWKILKWTEISGQGDNYNYTSLAFLKFYRKLKE